MAVTIRRKIRDALPKAAVPFARQIYLDARSHRLLTTAAKRRVARQHTGAERALVERANPNIAWNDTMFNGDRRHYFNAGLDALRVVQTVLDETGTQVRVILDLPSGWGRAARFFAAAYPEAKIVASDIVFDGPRYCAANFGAAAVQSKPDFNDLHFEDKFDLIFVGSLATHLDAESTASLLRLFARSLAPGGTLVLTTLGDKEMRRFQREGPGETFEPASAKQAISDYWSVGIGYMTIAIPMALNPEEHDLLAASRYGVTYTSPAWIERAAENAGLRRVYFKERGWDNLQDVHGLQMA